MKSVLQIHESDNVWVALKDLYQGEALRINGTTVKLNFNIPAKHKVAIKDLKKSDEVFMYGIKVGEALRDINKGDLISTENVRHAVVPYGVEDFETTYDWQKPDVSKWKDRTFMGYHRQNGKVGTANYWLVIPLVFCENRNVSVLEKAFREVFGSGKDNLFANYLLHLCDTHNGGGENGGFNNDDLSATLPRYHNYFENVSGIQFLKHQMGCGGTRDDAATLTGLLAGYIAHPNVAGATILSLGCQNVQKEMITEQVQKRMNGGEKPFYFFEQQKFQSSEKMLLEAIETTFNGMAEANQITRQPAPLSELVLGMECGGSDGFSGISANPVVGGVSDRMVALGGGVILSEFPELSGVEQNLIKRCVNENVARRFIELIHSYEKNAIAVGSGFDSNPSAGNIKDGLITDAIKSAGAALKGGQSPIKDVLDYPEMVKEKGLTLLCTPGNDVESTTAMAGSGATLILFTTGLGTPTGNPITPVIKISSNTHIYNKLNDIIDFNTGEVIEGTKGIDELADDLLEMVIAAASGEYLPKAVSLEQNDFIPWKRGVSL